jgi:UDPglucose 6-dehydrogenase
MKKISFIGVGKLGLPCAEVIKDKGYEVYGYDIKKFVSDKIIEVNSIKEAVEDKDLIFIAVPTQHSFEYDGRFPSSHLPPKDFDYEILKKCISEANKYMNKNQILVLISTILPGTYKSQLSSLVTNTNFVYNPYLIAMGSTAWDMVNPEMLIIGCNENNEKIYSKMINFYKAIMENNPRVVTGTWEECECIKIFYNTFISAKISLVNMIQDVSMKLGNINVDVVTKALSESNMRIMGPQYMTAGMGDGGACHPRDNIALRFLSKKLNMGYDLFSSIMDAREIQAKNIADFLCHLEKEKNMQIYIHGKAYKPGVEYLEGSYSILINEFLKKNNKEAVFIDPLTEKSVPKSIKGIILMAHSASITYEYVKHDNKPIDSYYTSFEKGSVIVDPWRKFPISNKFEVIHYGNTRNQC